MNKFLFGLIIWACCIAHPALAGCREDVQAMLEAGETWENYRIETVTSMGGTPVQHTQQRFSDYSHFQQQVRETGVHWLVLGNEEYTSSDGQTWQRSQIRGENWLEKTLARNAELRETIRDTTCGEEEIDGNVYRRFEHVQETVAPVASVSRVVTWLEPDNLRPFMRRMSTTMNAQAGTTAANSQIDMELRYFWDEEIVLPAP